MAPFPHFYISTFLISWQRWEPLAANCKWLTLMVAHDKRNFHWEMQASTAPEFQKNHQVLEVIHFDHWVYIYIALKLCLSRLRQVRLSVCLHIHCLSLCMSVCSSVFSMFFCLSVCLSVRSSVSMSVCLSVCMFNLSVCSSIVSLCVFLSVQLP